LWHIDNLFHKSLLYHSSTNPNFSISSINYFLVLHNIFLLHWWLKDIIIYFVTLHNYVQSKNLLFSNPNILLSFHSVEMLFSFEQQHVNIWCLFIKRKCFEGPASRLWFQLKIFSHSSLYNKNNVITSTPMYLCKVLCDLLKFMYCSKLSNNL